MDENNQDTANAENESKKQDCGCDGDCCKPKKTNMFPKLLFIVIMLAAVGIIGMKLIRKSEQKDTKQTVAAPGKFPVATPQRQKGATRKKIHPAVQRRSNMNSWISQVLSNEHATVTILFAVFVLGMISVVTCACNFAIIGVVAGYSGASTSKDKPGMVWLKGVTFLIGGVISMALIGTLFGYASTLISASFGSYWKIAAGLISILFGIYSMDLLPFKLPGIALNKAQTQRGIFSAILFGLAIGGLSTTMNSCCNPIFPVILAASFVKGGALWGLLMLTSFGLGFGLPLAAAIVGFGIGLGKVSRSLTLFGTIVKYAGGTILIIMGFYFLLSL